MVVDLDLEKFFDRVNHDILMGRIAKREKDKRVLKLIRAFLNAGVVMEDGVVIPTEEGTPRRPLSPLLSNLMLDDLDRELERRGHRFVRYADDCNIYVRTERAGQRVMEGITSFLSKKLKLKVNKERAPCDTVDAEISGIQLHERERAEEADSAQGEGTLPEASSGNHATEPRGEHEAARRRAQAILGGLDGVLRLLRTPSVLKDWTRGYAGIFGVRSGSHGRRARRGTRPCGS